MPFQPLPLFGRRTLWMPLLVATAISCLGSVSQAASTAEAPNPKADAQGLPSPNSVSQRPVSQIYFIPPQPAAPARLAPPAFPNRRPAAPFSVPAPPPASLNTIPQTVFPNRVPSYPQLQTRFCTSDLQRAIASIVDRPTFRTAQWGIVIEPLFEATSLYRHNADAFLIPASNVKLFTTAAAIRAVEESAPESFAALRERLMIINRYSDNLYADRLLAQIGGQTTVKRVLAPLGIHPNSFRQVDGSGLSRSNLAQPATLVRLLKGMYAYDRSGLFYYSLPVAGISGTLQRRFRATLAQGRVHAKTGTLNGVRALSGYIDNLDYGKIAFSIVVNQPGQSGEVLVNAIDQIVLQSARINRCF